MAMTKTRRDISGNPIPLTAKPLTDASGAPVTVNRPPEIEPPASSSREFILSWSIVAASSATSPLFVLDGSGNVIAGAAILLPQNTKARIAGVIIEGETGVAAGTPLLTFSLRTDPQGQQRLPGWENVNLPTRGGIVNMGIEPFTVIPVGYFIGAFVQNVDVSNHYAAITIQGWQF